MFIGSGEKFNVSTVDILELLQTTKIVWEKIFFFFLYIYVKITTSDAYIIYIMYMYNIYIIWILLN